MQPGEKLSKILLGIAQRRERAQQVLHGSPSAFQLLIASLVRQRTYLLWTMALSAIHLLEVWILIRFHYAFPPLSGLSVLRILSSLSLIGIFAALAFRSIDFDTRTAELNPVTLPIRLSRIQEAVRIVFLIGLGASSLLTLWVVGFSRLDLSSPAAFRAAIFSGIIGLPFDISAAFLLYTGGMVCALPISRRFRWLALGSSLVSLQFLALDLPLLYLVFSLAPRLLLLSAAWRNVSSESLSSLFILPKFRHSDGIQFTHLFKHRLLGSTLTQISFDFGFLLLFNRLGHYEQGLSLLLYVAHKAAHLAMVMFGKSSLGFSTELRSALLIREVTRVRAIVNTLLRLAALFALISFAFAPLFFLQRQTQLWLSPTGEPITVDFTLLLLGFVLSANCVAANVAQTFGTYGKRSRTLVIAASFLVCCALGHYLSPAVIYLLQARQVLILLALLHSALAALLLSSSVRALYAKADFNREVTPQPATLNELIRLLEQTPTADAPSGLFLVTLFHQEDLDRGRMLELFSPLLEAQDRLVLFGSRSALLFKPSCEWERLAQVRFELVHHLAGRIEKLLVSSSAGAGTLEFLSDLFRGSEPIAALYQVGSERVCAAPSEEATQITELLRNWQLDPSLQIEARLKAHGIDFYPGLAGYCLDQILDRETRKGVRHFLRRLLQSGEYLEPDRGRGAIFGPLLHLNRAGQPTALISIVTEKREALAALRFELFRLNLLDAISHARAVSPEGQRYAA